MMKRRLSLLLTLCLLLCLAACADGKLPGVIPNTTSAVETKRKTQEPETKESEIAAVLGTIDGDSYTNEALNVRVALPDGWSFYTEEQIAQANNTTVELLKNTDVAELIAKNGQHMDMMMSGPTGSNVNLYLQPSQSLLANYSDEKIFSMSEQSIKMQFSAAGMEIKEYEPITKQVGGEERTVLHLILLMSGVEIDEYQLWLRNGGEYMGVLTLAFVDGSDPQSILDGIGAIK